MKKLFSLILSIALMFVFLVPDANALDPIAEDEEIIDSATSQSPDDLLALRARLLCDPNTDQTQIEKIDAQ